MIHLIWFKRSLENVARDCYAPSDSFSK